MQGGDSLFQLNEHATFQMQEGCYEGAIATLQRVVDKLQRVTLDPGGFTRSLRTGYGSQEGCQTLQDISITSMPIDRDQASPMEPSCAVTDSIGDEFLFQMFERSFVTPFWSYEGPRGISLTWAFVLYNLGVCHHHKEVKRGTMNQQALHSAMNFYNGAMNAIGAAMGDGRPEDVTLLVLALHNNMGHLYSYLEILNYSKECLGRLRTLLESMPQPLIDAMEHDAYPFFSTVYIAVPEDIFNKAPAA